MNDSIRAGSEFVSLGIVEALYLGNLDEPGLPPGRCTNVVEVA